MKQMYKVFLNDRIIKICSGENITINQPSVSFDDLVSEKEIVAWFKSFEASNLKEISVMHSKPELFFTAFRNAFNVVTAAGGVVVSGDKIMVIYRQGKWDLPKGKLDDDETVEECALREVEEETGIRPAETDHRLLSTYHMYVSPYADSRGQWIFKETIWFQMNYNGNMNGTPQQEEGITVIKWISRHDLDQITDNTYENLKQVFDLYRD